MGQINISSELLETLINNGPDYIQELLRIGLNEAMRMERAKFLNAHAYERTKKRNGYANGFKPKTLNTRVGPITFVISQTRNSDFYPKSLSKGLRSERALTIAMMEMYLHGVSTRNVTKILEQMCGLEVSYTQVSNAAKRIDEELNLFKNRSLGEDSVLFVDAEYQRVRINGSVVDVANWLEKNVEDLLTYFDFHEFWWSKIRTSNCIERLNREIKRRTQIIGVFPNIESYRTSHRSYPYGKMKIG